MPFMKPYMVKLLREQFPPGTRIRLDSMMNDPQPIPKGMTGTVQGIDDAGQLLMEWDNGRGLSLVPGEDDFTVVKPQKLKLYMPLALGYYEKNDWGDYEDEELTLSDDEARSLGLNVTRLRFGLIVCATLITASTVAIAGIIGWVGLVVPHIARLLTGHNHQQLLPMAMCTGAILLLLTDTLARSIGTTEIPLGILTAFVGAPFFLFLLLRGGRQ